MNKLELLVLEKLMESEKTNKELSQALNKSISRVSRVIKSLLEKGLVKKSRKKGKIKVKKSSKLIYLSNLMAEFPIIKLLTSQKEKLLFSLLEKKNTVKKLQTTTGFSLSAIYSYLKDLKSLGVIKEEQGKYQIINENLINYLNLVKKEKHFEFGVTLLYSNKEKIIKTEKTTAGVLTAFSRFREYGIDYYPVEAYYYQPEKKLSLEEIFVHSLLAAENKKQMTMVILFYLKNRSKLNNHIVEKLAQKLNCQEKWLDVLAYLDEKKVKSQEYFLPWKEFKEKASLYKIKLLSKYPQKNLLAELENLGQLLKKEIKVFMIGGGNLILRKIKDTTKDLDLVVESKEDFLLLTSLLEKAGYQKVLKLEKIYEQMLPSAIMEKEGAPRCDIFMKIVCGALTLSEEMMERSLLFKKFDHLTLNLLSLEDIFLFKSITEREGDLEDALLLSRQKDFNWNLVLKELEIQEKLTQKYFCFDVLDTLDILKERFNLEAPILKKVLSHCLEKAILLTLKEKAKTVQKIKKDLNFSDYEIRNMLQKLEKEQRIKVNRTGKLNIYALS